jgi:hypothetical protein
MLREDQAQMIGFDTTAVDAYVWYASALLEPACPELASNVWTIFPHWEVKAAHTETAR